MEPGQLPEVGLQPSHQVACEEISSSCSLVGKVRRFWQLFQILNLTYFYFQMAGTSVCLAERRNPTADLAGPKLLELRLEKHKMITNYIPSKIFAVFNSRLIIKE